MTLFQVFSALQWHPTIAALDAEELLCASGLGQAPESLDYRTYLSRSLDAGKTWSSPVRLLEDPVERPSPTPCALPAGSMVRSLASGQGFIAMIRKWARLRDLSCHRRDGP